MKRSARFLIAVALCGGAACAGTSARPSGDSSITSSEALAVVRALDDAWRVKDTTVVARLLADDYRYFSSTGSVLSREWLLEDLLGNPTYQMDRSERSELQVMLHGTSAVVSSRWRGEGSYEGNPIRDDQRCTLVVVKDHDQAWIAMEHCTAIAP